MDPLAQLLATREWILLDGGLATELEARGHDLSDRLWSARLLLDAPEEIRAVHRSYVAAGADCVVTSSYQASTQELRRRGADPREVLLRSVALAAGAPLVAASVGPYGAALADGSEYTGLYPGMDESGLAAWHEERFGILDGSDADLLACETLPSFAEARALSGLLCRKHAWFSFTCRDARCIADGTPIREVAAFLDPHPGVAAIGVNCTHPRHVNGLIDELRAVTKKPVVVYPNSGEKWDAHARTWRGEASGFLDLAPAWLARGARILGGCCRVGPSQIRALATLRS